MDATPALIPSRLPVYALYGEVDEAGGGSRTDWLHCESIADRSRQHGWEIRPHRHESLFQILYIRRGDAVATLDGRPQPLAGPAVLCVPELAAHGFRFAPDIDGWVVTVLQSHLASLLAGEPGLREHLLRLRHVGLGREAAAAVHAAAQALRLEFHGGQRWRSLAIDTALLRLVLALARADGGGAGALPAPGAPSPARRGRRALQHVQRYRALVEQRFRDQPSLAALAGELGITPTQLNRVCRQALGHGALAVLHARVVLEAQRDLTYTTLSVKQIALGLGFADAGYFTRFFLRLAGCTPTAWRGRRAVAAVS